MQALCGPQGSGMPAVCITMEPQRAESKHEQDRQEQIPRKGDRIELLLPRLGIRPRGTVFYADDLQVLVKWDDGRSESLRPRPADRFKIIGDTPSG
jgi:hypothetical protein